MVVNLKKNLNSNVIYFYQSHFIILLIKFYYNEYAWNRTIIFINFHNNILNKDLTKVVFHNLNSEIRRFKCLNFSSFISPKEYNDSNKSIQIYI